MARRSGCHGTTRALVPPVESAVVAGSIFSRLLRRLMPDQTEPAATAPAPTPEEALRKEEEDAVRGLEVDPRARHIDLSELERTPSGPGFERLRIAGIPHWADAIAKRRRPEDLALPVEERISPAFDAVAALSAAPETRLAIGPSVRRALVEALVHAEAVRLGDGFAETIVPREKAGKRDVQDSVLTVARSFTGSPEPLDRILRWAVEDDSAPLRRGCIAWLLQNASHTPRTWDALRACLVSDPDDGVRLDAAAAIGFDGAKVIERIAEDASSESELRARALSMLASVCADETRLDRILLAAVVSGPAAVRAAALDAIVAARRAALGPPLAQLLSKGKTVADALLRLADPRTALAALESARQGEEIGLSLERIRIASELGGKEVVEPLRRFLTSGWPRELSSPARAAIENVKSRLTAVDGGLSLSTGDDSAGQLSPVSTGGELSQTPGAGARSEADKKRR